MSLELYQQIVLTHDLPEHHLKQGDVATLIDYVPHPTGKEDGCVLEIFNAIGESITVITTAQHDIEPIQADEIMTIRKYHPFRFGAGTVNSEPSFS
jgi:hypothetical protein